VRRLGGMRAAECDPGCGALRGMRGAVGRCGLIAGAGRWGMAPAGTGRLHKRRERPRLQL